MNHYCKNICGHNFSIKEWNEKFHALNKAGLEMPSDQKEPCKEQCFDCLAIVGEQRLKSKQYGLVKDFI